MGTLPTEAYLDALRRDGPALADAAERAGLSTEVVACPGWTVAELLWHTGEVHDFWREVVDRQAADPNEARPEDPPRPPNDELLDWYRDGVERLHATLAAADPAASVWTWTPQKDVACVRRRMAQETAVHRWDAEQSAAIEHAIEPGLAVDGIDEFVRFFLPLKRDDAERLGGSVHLHCTDADGEWLIEQPEGEEWLAVSPHHAKGDVAARGTASDLLLVLWRRRSPADVDVFGDGRILERFLAWTDLDEH
ncbi:MAG: maleylpyruvate isomerase family mycothiol-dependent enzyme [Acidimicrobiales bacterium]